MPNTRAPLCVILAHKRPLSIAPNGRQDHTKLFVSKTRAVPSEELSNIGTPRAQLILGITDHRTCTAREPRHSLAPGQHDRARTSLDLAKTSLSTQEIERLRRRHYNATLDEIIEPNDELRIVRVTPDRGIPEFISGQYVVMGVGNWEPRVEGVQDDHLDLAQSRKMTKRAYSISCSILSPTGEVVPAQKWRYLEFYVALVRERRGPRSCIDAATVRND